MFALSPLIIGLSALTYIATVQLSSKLALGRVFSSLMVVTVPMAVLLLQRFIYISGASLPLAANMLTWADIASILAQFIACLYIFTKLEQNDSYASWLGWVTAGFIIAVLAIPVLVRNIITF